MMSSMQITALSTALVAASVSPSDIAKSNPPAWMVPAPGTAALLSAGERGGGMTICDTADHYREWLNYAQPPGCRKFPVGQAVVIQGLVFDPAKDAISAALLGSPGSKIGEPLARVRIPATGFTGYLLLFGELVPVVPSGSILHLSRKGNEELRLAPSQDADLEAGIDLGEEAIVRVIRYAPSDARDLQVSVVDGPHKGKAGWMFSLEADDIGGLPITEFEYSILEQNRPLPPDFLYRGSD